MQYITLIYFVKYIWNFMLRRQCKLISDISLGRIPFTCSELATKGASMNQRRSVLFCLYLFWTESELSESYDGSVFRFLYPINTAVTLNTILDLLYSLRVYR